MSAAPLYFLHIAKTAGTSFRSLIDAHFEADEIAPFYLGHELAAALKENAHCVDEYPLLRGHLGYSPVLLMKQKPRIITMLRDPVERTISHYEHIIRHPDHWLFKDLPKKDLTLEEFLAFPPTRQLIRNFQVRNLAQDFDFTAPMRAADGTPLEANLGRLMAFIPPKDSDAALLKRARARMEEFAFAGITEHFERSMERLCEQFGWKAPEETPVHNAAPKEEKQGAAPSLSVIKEISELTVLDQELYNLAYKQFSE